MRSGAQVHTHGLASRHVYAEDNLDFYRTPPIGTKLLLEKERFSGIVWEPACGDGSMSRVLEESGSEVISTDLIDRGYGTRKDFLKDEPKEPFDHIVTNPPFKHAEEFIQRSLLYVTRPGNKVAFLCRLMFLESKRRKKLFESTPLARVWVFSRRINIMRNAGDVGDGYGGMVAFAWYVWEIGHEGPPTLGWL